MIDHILAKGWLPDFLIRAGIRQRLKNKLQEEQKASNKLGKLKDEMLIEELKVSPIAIETQTANEQHYEVPSEFY